MLRYINSGMCRGDAAIRAAYLKCFILLHFGASLHCGCNVLMQCTKIRLTGAAPPS
jgi:hypothetical protein